MKVQTKILLLLSLIVVIFVGGLSAAKYLETKRFARLVEARAAERTKVFDDLLEHRGESLEMLAKDFTYWDDIVRALQRQDRDWAAANLGDGPLGTYRANALWILHSDLSPFYAHNNLYATDLADIPVPTSAIPALFGVQKFCHFFAKTPQGLMEIRGATIHPSRDSARATPPQGYFFAGRIWTNETAREMSLFTDNKIRLTDQPPPPLHVSPGSISFSRELNGWDGKPLAYLAVSSESPVVEELTAYTDRLFVFLVLFALAVPALLAVSLMLWVNRPLQLISDALNRGTVEPLHELNDDHSEFGKLAQLIHHFFEQRAALINEMNERRGAEEALERSEDQLRQAQKMEAIGLLAGGIAHDFNNLLTAIIGYADLLIHRLKNDRAGLQCAEMVMKAGEQAASLTRQLLAFSRKQHLQPRVLDVNMLVSDIEKLLRRLIGEHIDLRTFLEAKEGRVKADPSQMEQVLLNLGVNARDAMPRGGVLQIRTADVELDDDSSRVQAGLPKGHYVVISVTDNGEGMSKETQMHIFEPFFTTKNPGHGTGLGLATVYGIIKQSDGGIAVDSAPGHGTSFRIYLPLESGPVDPLRAPPPPVEPTKMSETILVVEDEEIVRTLVCSVLRKQGYQVLCATRGQEALQMEVEHRGPIHLLITDVVMPEMNGQDLAQRLVLSRPETRVLYVSGYSNLQMNLTLDSDIELLEKPFTPQALARRVREMLASPVPHAMAK